MESCRERKEVRGKGKTTWLSEALSRKSGHAGAKDAGKIPGRKKSGATKKSGELGASRKTFKKEEPLVKW